VQREKGRSHSTRSQYASHVQPETPDQPRFIRNIQAFSLRTELLEQIFDWSLASVQKTCFARSLTAVDL
jgi:hypothetical protein